MEGKKISFGFMKTKKADKPLAHNNDDKRDYIECVEEQSIKIVGGEDDLPVNEPLVIPMKPNSLMKPDRLKEIALQVESALEEPTIKTEIIVDVNITDPLAQNETLDQMAERELLLEAKKEVVVENPTISIPSSTKGVAEGENESTLDDYEAVPVQEFGVAMLRGMGWTPGDAGPSVPVERASQPSALQVDILLNFLEKNPVLAKGFSKLTSQRRKAQKDWERLALILNKRGGSRKSWRQWTKYWTDKKHAIRRKVAKNNSGDPNEVMELSAVEERIYALLESLNEKPAPQTSHNPQTSQVHEPPPTTNQHQPIIIPKEEPIVLYGQLEEQLNDQPRRIVVGLTGKNVSLAVVDPPAASSNRTCPQPITIPSLKGITPPAIRQNISTKPQVAYADFSSINRPPRNSLHGRRHRIARTKERQHRSADFSRIVEQFLRLEEKKLEHNRRTTNVLETVTRVVSRVLERDAENNRMMSQAMLSIGEGLKLLSEAVKSHEN